MGSELMLMCAGAFLDVMGKSAILLLLFMVATWPGSVLARVVLLAASEAEQAEAAVEYLGSVAPLLGGEPNMPCSHECPVGLIPGQFLVVAGIFLIYLLTR